MSNVGASSEVGTLRTVLQQRPGPELRRHTPRNNAQLLAEALDFPAARAELIAAAVDDPRLGTTLQRRTTEHLADLPPEELAGTLIAGLAHDELRADGLAYRLMGPGEFVVPPLPNLLFTRDSSVWVGDEVAVT